jgi:uncharacterized membrane protein
VKLFAQIWTFLAFAGGLALIAAGAWVITPAAGLIVAGVALAGSAVLYELRPTPYRQEAYRPE